MVYAALAWFGKGMVPAILLGISSLAHTMPKRFDFLDKKLGPISYRMIVGVAGIISTVAIFAKW